MKASENSALPRARSEGLIVKELPDEVLVYDLESHKAHCLNGIAAVIWKHFDGETSISDVAARVSVDGPIVDAEIVSLALHQLRKAKLIVPDCAPPRSDVHLSRRDLIKKLGLAATAVPLVTSILAPTAYAAVSCGSEFCGTTADCPDGCICIGNTCVAGP